MLVRRLLNIRWINEGFIKEHILAWRKLAIDLKKEVQILARFNCPLLYLHLKQQDYITYDVNL